MPPTWLPWSCTSPFAFFHGVKKNQCVLNVVADVRAPMRFCPHNHCLVSSVTRLSSPMVFLERKVYANPSLLPPFSSRSISSSKNILDGLNFKKFILKRVYLKSELFIVETDDEIERTIKRVVNVALLFLESFATYPIFRGILQHIPNINPSHGFLRE